VNDQTPSFFENDIQSFPSVRRPFKTSTDWSLSTSHVEDGTTELIIRCRECLKVFATIQAYLGHLSVHRKRASSVYNRTVEGAGAEKETFYKYPCPCCDMTFSGHTNFRGHWSKHSGVKEFVCGECGLRYAYKQMLKDHVLQHHPAKWLSG